MASRYNVLLFAVLCVSAAAVSHAASLSDSYDDNALPLDVTSRMLNGIEAEDGEFRHQVAIFENKIFVCGGTIINHNTILTAASCVTNPTGSVKSADNFQIGVGDHNLNNYNDSLTLRVESIWVHGNYNPTTQLANLAVLRADGKFQYSEKVFPAQIAAAHSSSAQCNVSGWGAIWNSPLAPEMQHLYYGTVNVTTCDNVTLPLPSGVFCAVSNTTDSCSGDVGGPVICDDKLMGLVSHSDCVLGNRGVYTSVPNYVPWLELIMNQQYTSDTPRLSPGMVPAFLAVIALLWVADRR